MAPSPLLGAISAFVLPCTCPCPISRFLALSTCNHSVNLTRFFGWLPLKPPYLAPWNWLRAPSFRSPLLNQFLRSGRVWFPPAIQPPGRGISSFLNLLPHFSLSLPGVRARLTKYQAERTGDGLYVTSNDLLKIAIKYEENVIAGRGEEIRLGLKDPFVTVGELPGAVKRGKSPWPEQDMPVSPSPRRWKEVQDDQPSPKLWEPEGMHPGPRERSEMRRGIEILNKKIDELSELYNKKLQTGKLQEEVCVNSVIPDTSGNLPAPNPTMTEMWEKMQRPFFEAQWSFYSAYD